MMHLPIRDLRSESQRVGRAAAVTGAALEEVQRSNWGRIRLGLFGMTINERERKL